LLLTLCSPLPETAQIFVDEDPDPFLINLDLICEVPYFANAFRGAFTESESKTITLRDVDRSTVSDFLDWVRALPKPRTRRERTLGPPHSPRRLEHPSRLAPLVKLWVFADKYRVPKLQNQAMAKIADLYSVYDGKNIQPSLIGYVYDNSQLDSPLRRIIVDFAAAKMHPDFYSEIVSELHVEFLEDLCLAQMKLARQEDPYRQVSPIHSLLYFVSENTQDERDPDAAQQREARENTNPRNLSQFATIEQLAQRKLLVPRRPRQPKEERKFPGEI
jgi:hypothetical protein